ncbi:MAG: MBL fold metallo-hydrolase [Lachnospiraceae bacterium]|nr:MBL fold metallo-hydrolase [Lachnospiraceae bacterium]
MKVTGMTLGMVGTNVWICVNEETKEAFVVDPADGAEQIEAKLAQNQWTLKGILLTHGHFDHIGAVEALRNAYQVPVWAAEAERELLSDVEANLSGSWTGRPIRVKADHWLQDLDCFMLAGMRIQMILTPGHTAGSCCYYLAEEHVLLSGDTLFAGSCGRTDLPTGSMNAIVRSIRERLFALPPETEVYPGHGETTSIGWEQRSNAMV